MNLLCMCVTAPCLRMNTCLSSFDNCGQRNLLCSQLGLSLFRLLFWYNRTFMSFLKQHDLRSCMQISSCNYVSKSQNIWFLSYPRQSKRYKSEKVDQVCFSFSFPEDRNFICIFNKSRYRYLWVASLKKTNHPHLF